MKNQGWGIFVVFLVGFAPGLFAEGKLPNVVVVLADDLGYGDVQAYHPESRIPTPNMNRIATEGMTFTDGHSGSSVCTPTRYGVVMGRYCWRTWKKKGVLNGYDSHLINPDRMSIADVFKSAGYQTACIGKWHLGMDFVTNQNEEDIDFGKPIQNGPNANGFDYFYGISASLDFPPFNYIENDHFTETEIKEVAGQVFPGYLREGPGGRNFNHTETLDHLTQKATAYITEQASRQNPFFLYFPLTSPHKPVLPAKRFQGKSGLGPYGDFVLQTDWVVGQVLDVLDQAGIAENTLIVFSSDNGSFMYRLDAPECGEKVKVSAEGKGDHVGDPSVQGYFSAVHQPNHPWKGTKADIWEAGHRVPYLMRWPEKITAGTRSDTTVCLTDLMATFAAMVDIDLPKDAGEDSFSLLPLMEQNPKAWKRDYVINHSINGSFAIRDNEWKLIATSGSGGRGNPKSGPSGKPHQLYNLKDDPGERVNLIDQYPEVATRLEKELRRIKKGSRRQ
jgi:arylsulfatase A-like enzyme